MRRLAAVVTSLAFVLAASRGRADEPAKKGLRIAVLDVRPLGVDGAVAKTLTEVLAVEVGKTPDVQVVTDAQIESLLGLEQKKQFVGCDDNASCMAEIAGALGVDKVLSSSLGKVDDLTIFTVHLIDVSTARQDGSVQQHDKSASAFIDAMPSLVAKLLHREVAPALAASAPPTGVITPPPTSPTPNRPYVSPAATPSAPPVSTTIGFWARKPWVWAATGGVLMLLGGSTFKLGESNPGSTTVISLGIVAGVVSFGLCVCPANWGSGSDEPPVTVLDWPAPSRAAAGALRDR